jgi:tripartite-type tricarboxylate transporter receptor subunit TctC
MQHFNRRLISAALLGAFIASPALAQESAADFPSRPIKIIVPFGPGASNDTLARMLGAQMQESLKQPVVVENRTGASGDIGLRQAATSKPDGYTLLLTSNAATVSTASKKRPVVDLMRDLQPLTLIGSQPMLLVTSAQSSINSTADFVKLAQSAPDRLSYATPGTATPHHMTFELISAAKGLKMVHVPFPGTGPAVNEVMAERIDLTLATQTSGGPLVQSGRLKVLAAVSKQRLKDYPNAPTLIEAGLGELETGFWYGVTAPAGLPAPIAAKLNAALAAALAQPAVKEQIRKLDIELNPIQGPAFGAFINADYQRWKKVAQTANINID